MPIPPSRRLAFSEIPVIDVGPLVAARTIPRRSPRSRRNAFDHRRGAQDQLKGGARRRLVLMLVQGGLCTDRRGYLVRSVGAVAVPVGTQSAASNELVKPFSLPSPG